MIRFVCDTVYSGWEDIANPDDIDVVVELERTTHEVYPSLRELVRLYDAAVNGRDTEFVIGTADYVELNHGSGDTVEINLAPVEIIVDRDALVVALKDLLQSVFEEKTSKSSPDEREQGLNRVQSWIDEHDATTDVRTLYNDLTEDT